MKLKLGGVKQGFVLGIGMAVASLVVTIVYAKYVAPRLNGAVTTSA